MSRATGGLACLCPRLARFASISAEEGRISGPDVEWSRRLLVLTIGNGQQAGGHQRLCPQAMLDNGVPDVRIMAGDELRPALVTRLPEPCPLRLAEKERQ